MNDPNGMTRYQLVDEVLRLRKLVVGSHAGPLEQNVLEQMRELATASSPGSLLYGQMEQAEVLAMPAKTCAENGTTDEKQWTTWLPSPSKDGLSDGLIVAVTGNGPTSKANARFFSRARAMVLLLIDELETTRLKHNRTTMVVQRIEGPPDLLAQSLGVDEDKETP